MENEAHGLLSMPGVGFFGMLVIGILAGYIAEKVTTLIMACSPICSSALPAPSSAARSPLCSTSPSMAGSAI